MGLFKKRAAAADVDRLTAELAALREQIERQAAAPPPAPSGDVDALTGRIDALDARVTSVSTELANQLQELSGDIDAAARAGDGDGTNGAVIGELRDGQVRLANEQARYQIAFREDLARLAEQVRRPRA